MKKFFRHYRLREKVQKDFWRTAVLQKKIILLILVLMLLFLCFFFGRIFWGNTGAFAREFPKFWNFSAIILLQNDAEIRPTGGFLSGFFLLEIKSGIPHFSFFDSYSLAPPSHPIPAPKPLADVFSADPKFSGFVARDSNFSPDFPESSATFLSFLSFDPRFSEKKIDAVIAVNFSAIERIARDFLGESSARDLFLRIQRDSKDINLHNLTDLSERKNSANEILEELKGSIGFFGLPRFLEISAQEADRRNIQLAFFDPELAEISAKKNWDGALPDDEFWGINIANLGAKKSDRFTRRQFFSEIFFDERNRTTEKLTIVSENFGGENILSGSGAYYLRIFRPLGTTFLGEIPPGFSQKNFPHFTEFSTTIWSEPGEKSEISVSFLLPRFPSEMHWHGQSGTEIPLFLSVSGVGETRFFSPHCRDGLVLFCEKNIAPDADLVIEKVSDKFPPFLENAVFTNDREIFLRFSESILSKGNPENFQMECEGKNFPVEKILFSSSELRDATLLLSQKVPLGEGFCEMKWSGISDLSDNIGSGNITIPRKKE